MCWRSFEVNGSIGHIGCRGMTVLMHQVVVRGNESFFDMPGTPPGSISFVSISP